MASSEEDQSVADSFGGLYFTPPYLIEVKPVLRIGGVAVSSGTGPVGMGVQYTLRLQLETPGGREEIENVEMYHVKNIYFLLMIIGSLWNQ